MNENVILTVGNTMMGDDGAGPYLAQLCSENPLPNWTALDGGSAPENLVDQIRAMKPKRLIIFDATEIEQLEEDIPEVIFIGIQPDLVSFGFPMSEAVKSAVEFFYEFLKDGGDLGEITQL